MGNAIVATGASTIVILTAFGGVVRYIARKARAFSEEHEYLMVAAKDHEHRIRVLERRDRAQSFQRGGAHA